MTDAPRQPDDDRGPFDTLAYMLCGLGLGIILVWSVFGFVGIAATALCLKGAAAGFALVVVGGLIWLCAPHQ